MSMTLREALHGERGAIDQLNAWLGGERPKNTSAGEGAPIRPITARAWFTLDGHTARELVFQEVYPEPTKVTPENLLIELEDTLAGAVGTRPVGLLEVRYHEEGRADWPGVKLQRKLRDLTEADQPMSTTFLRGEVARLNRENGQLVDAIMGSHGDLRTLVATQAEQLAHLATQRATTTSAADLSSPWAPIGMMMLFVLVPVVQRSIGLKAGSSLVDTVERLVDIGKTLAKKQKAGLESPAIPSGAGGEPQLTAAEELEEESKLEPSQAAAIALLNAGIKLDEAGAGALAKLLTSMNGNPLAQGFLQDFAKGNGIDLSSVLPEVTPPG